MSSLRLPARMESFGPFRSFVLTEMERTGDLEDLVPRVDLVLEEVLVNAIHYAYPGDHGEIEVECVSETPGGFRITVKDWGIAFNPLEQAPPDLSADVSRRQVGGLGIFFVKQMTERLHYEYREGGNVLTMWFQKNGANGAD